MVIKLRPLFSLVRHSGVTLQNFSVSADVRTVPTCVTREMNWRCVLPVQSCCNLFEIFQKYSNSYNSCIVTLIRKPSCPTISFFKKSCFAELHWKWYGNFGLLWNFLFGHIPNTVIHRFKQYSIQCLLSHVALPHNDKNSYRELIDFSFDWSKSFR
jgi:hypothetical protein